jgi:hypothetical protein
MAIVRTFGKPDLFITMTCNPKWKEITSALKPGQTPADRPDLVTRVFRLKLQALLDDLIKHGILGRVVAHIHVVEWQKRGLPHAHILLILHPDHKPRTPAEIDSIVSAELPSREINPRLYTIVTNSMLHGPCGEGHSNCPCMKNGQCKQKFPKLFQETTYASNKTFPLYRRRNQGHTFTKGDFIYDNCWIVPYNPYLCLKYNCHINVEICILSHL